MKIVNIQEAKTHLSKLVEQAAAGEDLVIAKAGKPMVRLVPYEEKGKFRFGILAGQGWEAPNCWDSDPEIEELFYGPPDEFESSLKVAEKAPLA